ncbi:alginate lyase family protein [Algibacter miyuki]|uniref:Alginate lyase family protein n=1 Tax=Algibacter miyuki TaxID=1306933 RepID=A0ABV5GUG7_9FLAO|nr:alginate lyase family protein [Algibacter miyuki]MDN3664605.1 alginate lyase family protein [Algibacter miyuki]
MKLTNKIVIPVLFSVLFLGLISCKEQESNQTEDVASTEADGGHPNLVLTKNGVKEIRKHLGTVPIFDKSLAETKAEVDAEIELGIEVPIPKDYSGGYTHSRHKLNFIMMQKAGVLFQILDDEKYAVYVRDMLMAYAKLYPTLPVHPQTRSYARGKLFWQCLNDSNWLVYTAQAYDCVYDWLSAEDRELFEKDLFVPFAKFISEGNPQFFNRVHNHSTWGNVAVGMIALVMDNDALLKDALEGLETDNLKVGMKDDDGGFIKVEGQKLGFYGNLDEPFSPDGYYTEGPYYQRYAMYPFLIFAEALENVKPEMKIFEYKDGVLIKAVDALLNLSDANGDFFPLNDGQKGMSYYTSAVVTAVDIAYYYGGKNPGLLSIAKKQDRVVLDDTGLSIALGLKDGLEKPFEKKSVELSDGPNGDEGAVGILRSDNLEVVFKYAAQGLSHGHYDKLSYSLYEDGEEVAQDYGLARYVNIEQKGGGNYLKENKTWAKQSIAHNTLVQNETSHFQGKYEIGSTHHSEKYVFDVSNPKLQVASAKENNAYPGTKMQRTMVFITDDSYSKPYLLDIMKVVSDNSNQYDLPFYYLGQIMQTSFDYEKLNTPTVFGKSNGYQHLYKEAEGVSDGSNAKLNWLLNGKFYSVTSATSKGDELILAKIGANDKDYNLRNEPGFIIRKKNAKNTVFASVVESHGAYSAVSEFAVNAYSHVKQMDVVFDSDAYTAVEIETDNDKKQIFVISNLDNDPDSEHQLTINGKALAWTGAFTLKALN